MSENIFMIKEENKELLEIANILGSYINQEYFDNIQNIYEKSKEVVKNEKQIFNNIGEKNNGRFHYAWLSGDDPVNIVLGYICDCCAKYDAAGEDIMIQSMINPSVKNLVIYDGMQNIIGKSTAYYNMKEKYIVFNNIEMQEKFIENKKTTAKQKKEVLEAILRGIKDQIKSMQEKGYEVIDVRMGMLRNDLKEEILAKKIKIVHKNLLKNYNYKDYAGDANDEIEGQAIVKILK